MMVKVHLEVLSSSSSLLTWKQLSLAYWLNLLPPLGVIACYTPSWLLSLELVTFLPWVALT